MRRPTVEVDTQILHRRRAVGARRLVTDKIVARHMRKHLHRLEEKANSRAARTGRSLDQSDRIGIDGSDMIEREARHSGACPFDVARNTSPHLFFCPAID